MKIAIPVDEKNRETNISQSFGRAPYFMIYETNSKERVYLENEAAASPGGAGIKAAQIIVDSGAKVLLTPRCGGNAEEVLRNAEILLYQTQAGTAQTAIDAYLKNRLQLLVDIYPGVHSHGGIDK